MAKSANVDDQNQVIQLIVPADFAKALRNFSKFVFTTCDTDKTSISELAFMTLCNAMISRNHIKAAADMIDRYLAAEDFVDNGAVVKVVTGMVVAANKKQRVRL